MSSNFTAKVRLWQTLPLPHLNVAFPIGFFLTDGKSYIDDSGIIRLLPQGEDGLIAIMPNKFNNPEALPSHFV